MLDLQRARRDTPGCFDRVFLDSAGSSLPPTPVLETTVAHLRREAEVGGYVAAAERADDLAAVKTSIARLIGAEAPSIALVESATRAWASFFYSVPLRAGDRILLTRSEYASNAVSALQRARATGATVETMPTDALGRIDVDALTRTLDERVKLVSVVHAPTNGGLVNPVREVADAAHAVGALVLLDACQSVGQLPVSVPEFDVDALSATGRKWLRGPRGTGFLYVRPRLVTELEPAVLDLHSAQWTAPGEYRLADDATRFELWETNVAARLGLGAAVDYLLDLGVDAVTEAVAYRAEHLREGLGRIPGVAVRDLGKEHSGIVSFTVDGWEPPRLREALAAEAITVTVSGRGSTLLEMSARRLESVVRASPHYFVSPADVDRFLAAVRSLTRS
ncbi:MULTISPECIES: aminotransferase class V-fold PLP-dependent enzyme [Rhodococcus]|uniref:aminotransferase class V-fold PLP-dependent enzyme n=1 Tax=Rhodococcus TaxID=1827 RepID=UPI0007CD8D7C|nr:MULTISPECIES: aminotransferase class V-fold PLP-dependent enzyme [Rhodococcus]MDO2376803.1 aminotransferase class V-fold PLP-dependent enzyme [Rhodococcus ruber]AUM16159.1 aminotransferase class V-fold PLP-dependent enzyme [Rhodococcus ruber]AWG98153.1 aminotransferase class V-fold PLP-dependent enzyme [Rhodococcus ruber]MBD8052569.1 aminotransferase class V-fold PLP-dependent enzyme [Rhodococcus ruber]MCF8783797.1 aminotransferase class V-fold PLP-dependent enzyme [Rhodococcus ruber]